MFLIRVVGAEWVVEVVVVVMVGHGGRGGVGVGGSKELHGCLCLGLTHISHQRSLLCVPRIGSLGPSDKKQNKKRREKKRAFCRSEEDPARP